MYFMGVAEKAGLGIEMTPEGREEEVTWHLVEPSLRQMGGNAPGLFKEERGSRGGLGEQNEGDKDALDCIQNRLWTARGPTD